MQSHDAEYAAAGGYGLPVKTLVQNVLRAATAGLTIDQVVTAAGELNGYRIPVDRVAAALSALAGEYHALQRDGLWFGRDHQPAGQNDYTDPEVQQDALDAARARWDHGEAPYEPTVLGLIRVAEAMQRQLAELRADHLAETAATIELIQDMTSDRLAGGELERRLASIKEQAGLAGTV